MSKYLLFKHYFIHRKKTSPNGAWSIMKMNLILLLILVQVAYASGHSQSINISCKDSPIENVLKIIKKSTGYGFIYNPEILHGLHLITLDVKNGSVKEVLELCFKNSQLTYEIRHNTIIIKRLQPKLQNYFQNPVPLTITGTVLDERQKPLPGVNILIKGTTLGTSTDNDGRYSLPVDPGATLVFSYVGYLTEETVVAEGTTEINMVLIPDISSLGEIVVTALGIKKATKELTYNVQEIKGSEVNLVKDANFINALAGRVAGVTINSSSAGIGGGVRVVMRGAKSLFGNNNALYVVDGIPLPSLTGSGSQVGGFFEGANATGDGISNINPDDIASISVLTGPAAAALYGSQAANGVILITTKKGTNDKSSLSFSSSANFYTPLILPKVQNEYGSEPGSYSSWGAKLNNRGDYNPADFFQTGYNVTNTVSLSTGSEKNQTYISAAAVNTQGIIGNNNLNRYNFSVRNTTQLIKEDKLNQDISLMYSKQEDQNMLAQGQYFNPLVEVYLFPRGDDLDKYKVYERYNEARNFKTQFWPFGDLGFSMQNPYWITHRNIFTNNLERYILGYGLKYKINDWATLSGRVKMDNTNTSGESKYYASTWGVFAGNNGKYGNTSGRTRQVYADVLLNITKSFNDITVNTNLGSSLFDVNYSSSGFSANLGAVPNLFSMNNADVSTVAPVQNRYHDAVQAVFGSMQLGYKNMVFVDATLRNEWTSALANSTKKSLLYPSVGVSGILSDLLNIHSNTVSFIKLKGSYAEVGNSPQRFITQTAYPISNGVLNTISYKPATNLKPERTKSYEAGVNLKFLDNKINLDVTGYTSNTYDQLFNVPISSSTGYNSLYINAGKVNNKGVEAALGYDGKIGPLGWTVNTTLSLNRNKIIRLLPESFSDTGEKINAIDSIALGGTGSYMMAIVRGGSIGDLYTTTLVTDEHGYIKVDPRTSTIAAAPNVYIKAGSANPKFTVGFNNSFAYKNFTLSFLVFARVGGVGVSVTQAIMDGFGVSEESAKARDNGGVNVNGYKVDARSYYQVTDGGQAGVGSLYVYSMTNVRLREASLGYTIPVKFFRNKVQEVTLALTGRNLFMLYNKAPFDPESTPNTGTYYQNVDYFMQPSLRSLGFSAKVRF